MAQGKSVVILSIGLVLLLAPGAALRASYGDWGGPLGDFLFPFVMFYALAAAFYFGRRLFSREPGGRSFAASRLNYVALAFTLASVAAGPAQPPTLAAIDAGRYAPSGACPGGAACEERT